MDSIAQRTIGQSPASKAVRIRHSRAVFESCASLDKRYQPSASGICSSAARQAMPPQPAARNGGGNCGAMRENACAASPGEVRARRATASSASCASEGWVSGCIRSSKRAGCDAARLKYSESGCCAPSAAAIRLPIAISPISLAKRRYGHTSSGANWPCCARVITKSVQPSPYFLGAIRNSACAFCAISSQRIAFDLRIVVERELGIMRLKVAPGAARAEYEQIIVTHPVGDCRAGVFLQKSQHRRIGRVQTRASGSIKQPRLDRKIIQIRRHGIVRNLRRQFERAPGVIFVRRSAQRDKNLVRILRAGAQPAMRRVARRQYIKRSNRHQKLNKAKASGHRREPGERSIEL